MTDTQEVAAVDKPMVYWDPAIERYVYRASALMSCQNALLLARMGVDGVAPPEKFAKRFAAGHELEDLILAKLDKERGTNCYAQQQELEINVGKGALIRGHIDALTVLTNGMSVSSVDGVETPDGVVLVTQGADGEVRDWIAVVDAKAFAPSTMKEWDRKRFETELGLHYLWQQATYLYAGEFDAIVMACYDKVTSDLRVDVFTADWIKKRLPKATIFQRVMWCEQHAPLGAVFDNQCSPKQYPCPFFPLHPEELDEAGEKIVGDGELLRMGRLLDEARGRASTAKEDVERIEKDIAAHVGGKPTKGVKFPDFTIGTSYGSHPTTDWPGIASALDLTIEQAKEKFQGSAKNEKLSVRITKPKS